SRPANSCYGTALSIALSHARICAPKWPGSSITVNISPSGRRTAERGTTVGFFASLFSSKPKGKKLPIVDVKKRFDLLGRTGQGSMSRVYRAYDRKLGRTVCLKVLDKEKTAKFEARFPGLQRPMEGAVCTALHHRNIVQTFEYGLTKQGEQYLVMEFIEGLGFNFLIETQSPQLKGKRIAYLVQLAEGLEYIHQQRYLHR